LGGGGARGLAHIGVLKAFDRAGIPISMIAGASMGGIIGVLYLVGINPEQLQAEAQKRSRLFDMIRLLDLKISREPYLARGTRIRKILEEALGDKRSFSDLPKPFAVTAVDIKSGREVILREGDLVNAVRATMSVPGVFAPVEWGDMLLVDGGILNNVPVDVAREMGADIVVAVDVLPHFRLNQPGGPIVTQPLTPRRVPRVYADLWHVQLIMIAALTEHWFGIRPPDIIIRPELPVDMDILMGFDRSEEAIVSGERATEAVIPQVLDLINRVE
jgi:NTE family protein